MKTLWIVGATLLMSLAYVGCSDDDDGDDGGTGGSATGGSGTGGSGTGGSGTGGSATGGSGTGGMGGLPATVSCDPEGDGVCENETDCQFVESGQLRATGRECGSLCATDEDPSSCAVECINMELGSSSECSACYAALVGCSAENCVAQCAPPAGSPEAVECTQCQEESGCFDEFEDCSGLDL